MGTLELNKLLKTVLVSPNSSVARSPPSLSSLCIRTAAIYATTSLYEFHDKHQRIRSSSIAETHGDLAVLDGSSFVGESAWEAVFPLLDQHFFQLVPCHLYEQFLDNILCSLEVANRFDLIGKQLTQYIILFFPRHIKRFRAQKYNDKVLLPTICCLHKCTDIEELYLEKADSPCVTTYLLAHILKFTTNLKVLSLPKQCDDDVASIVGINCKKLESIVITGTNITNLGLSWLVCCRNLHTIIMPGFFAGISPKGVAILLNGLPSLCHVVYDVMSDVLTYVDFNTSPTVLPKFNLKSLLLHSMELLSTNHLELVTKLCPMLEWLSLDSALFYNLEGLGHLPNLTLLRLNYKSRRLDQTVVDFFNLNCQNLTTLHLFDVKDLSLDDMQLTIGQCKSLDNLVMSDCSLMENWDQFGFPNAFRVGLSKSIRHLQLLSFILLQEDESLGFVKFLSLFKGLRILDMDRCDLDLDRMKMVLIEQPELHTLRCTQWTNTSAQNLANLQMSFRNCSLQMKREEFAIDEDCHKQTMAASLLSDYATFSPILGMDTFL